MPHPLFPPERIKLHVLTFDCGRSYAAVLTVTDLQGVARVVDRQNDLTLDQVEALRAGRAQ